jgi:hypothetical protein
LDSAELVDQIVVEAKLHVTQHCELPLEAVLDLQSFDLSRALAIDGQLLDKAVDTRGAKAS